ncbi:hypothetical protein QE152_g38788 [Popillia japonica]|uniref:Zinc finger PHD-type domain-containing protein n=1 Tax=Popillia japonica TaxID=7064 RepID=A0AAW1HVY8_POPJA
MYEASETTNISISDDNPPSTSKENNKTGISEQTAENQTEDETTNLNKTNSVLTTTVADLSPLPIGPFVSGQGKRKQRKRNKTTVLNSTPNIEELKEKTIKKIVSEKRKRTVTRKILLETDTEEEDPFANDEEDDCSCIYCTDQYRLFKPREIWLKCGTCKNWAQTDADCAGVDKKTKVFVCEICTDA